MLPIVTVLAIVTALLWWHKQHPYIVTRDEMRSALERVLDRTMPPEEWHRLVQRRIPRDRYLDSVRSRIAALAPVIGKEGEPVQYSPRDTQVIAAILDELRTKRA